MTEVYFSNPWLIQRASVKKNWSEGLGNSEFMLSDAVKLHYMGAAEFEFGALPKSLRKLASAARSNNERLVPRELPHVRDRDGRPMIAVGLAAGEEEVYALAILKVINEKARCKENPRFEDMVTPLHRLSSFHALKSKPPKDLHGEKARQDYIDRQAESITRFWWDLDNTVMLSFEPDLMAKLPEILIASWTAMEVELPVLPNADLESEMAPAAKM